MKLRVSICTIILFLMAFLGYSQDRPNVLLIIADDLGIDAIKGYQDNSITPATPTLDSLRENGLMFRNTWATPQCTPTRSSIMSGKFGVNTGVMRPPGNLDLEHQSLFNKLAEVTDSTYSSAVIGKWHISDPVDYNHPSLHGLDHYEGLFTSQVDDYYDWEKIVDGQPTQVQEYVTTNLTNSAIDWLNEQSNQEKPWFLWLAHVAPHIPFHVPPTGLYTTSDTTTRQQKYIAAIEAMDSEIGRLIDNIDQETLKNTIIFFVGDNGTPGPAIQYYPQTHAKSSIYEGGIRVPMLVSGYGVSRVGQEEEGLTQLVDLYATILEVVGYDLPGGIYNSLSFEPSLSNVNTITRRYNYSDYEDGNIEFWAIRNDQYKLIEDENGNQEFYDISASLLEDDNLIGKLSVEQELIKSELEQEAVVIRSGWSCNDGIQNGDEEGVDECDNECVNDNSMSTVNIGCCETPDEPSIYYEYLEGDQRKVYTNDFPNHSYCYNPNLVPEQTYYLFGLNRNPAIAQETTKMTRDNGRPARYYGVAKNGVLLAPAPATPFIFENPNTGQYNWDWVFEPTTNQGDGAGLVSLDCSSAHTGPQGYHYHGNMFEYMETVYPGVTTTVEPLGEVVHVGWASDGFPIVYRFGPDENGDLIELLPSFKLKSGVRPGDGVEAPCGLYNGKYTNDYEFIVGQGDLDACNGIERKIEISTSEGVEEFDYFYVITSSFPQIGRCVVGTPSVDFENSSTELVGVDEDGDGFLSEFDCDDSDPLIHPNANEVLGNTIDENCDGLITSINNIEAYGISAYSFSVGSATIKGGSESEFTVGLISEKGIKVKSGSSKSGLVEFDQLNAGFYIVNIQLEKGISVSTKIIVK